VKAWTRRLLDEELSLTADDFFAGLLVSPPFFALGMVHDAVLAPKE
jgi:hypothetical protein